MSAGTDYRVKIDFDTKRLVGGMESVEWGTIEVYSSSGGTDDINEDNNRDILYIIYGMIVQICQKRRWIGCVIPHFKLQRRITQPILQLF